jgi:hypothetical protein
LTPWDDAESLLSFSDATGVVTGLVADEWGQGGHAAFLLLCSSYSGSRGFVSVETPYWSDGHVADEGRFVLYGEAAGDELGARIQVADWDTDDVADWAIGAPSADPAGSASGAVYLVPGPR